MKLRPAILGVTVVLGVLGIFVASEVSYARRISPKGITTVQEFLGRFGEPRCIRMVRRDNKSFYEFTGQPPKSTLALPSSAPVYFFDEQGQFAGWVSDPGDSPGYRKTWVLESTNLIEIGVVKQKLGLQ